MKVGVFSSIFQDLLRSIVLTDDRGKPWFES